MSDPNRKMRTLQTRLLFDELRDGLEHVPLSRLSYQIRKAK